MTDKEELIELLEMIENLHWEEISNSPSEEHAKNLINGWHSFAADHLIANGMRVQKRGRWVSIEDEQKPKDRRNYFIAYVFGNSDIHFFGEAKYHAYEGNGVVHRPHFSNEGVNGMRVTHWMEIPELPNCGADMRGESDVQNN